MASRTNARTSRNKCRNNSKDFWPDSIYLIFNQQSIQMSQDSNLIIRSLRKQVETLQQELEEKDKKEKSGFLKQIQVLQKQNVELQDMIEVQKREFVNYTNTMYKIDNFDKLPEFDFIKSDIQNKTKIYNQEQIIQSLHKQAEKKDKQIIQMQIDYSTLKDQLENMKYQIQKKKYPEVNFDKDSYFQDLERQLHNYKSMISIMEHEIKDKIVEIKLLHSGMDMTKQQVRKSQDSIYKVDSKEAKYQYSRSGKSDYVYLESDSTQVNRYIDEINISGSSSGKNSYISLQVFNEQDKPLTQEHVVHRNIDDDAIAQDDQLWKCRVRDGDIVTKLQDKGNRLKVLGRSITQDAQLLIQQIFLGIVYFEKTPK